MDRLSYQIQFQNTSIHIPSPTSTLTPAHTPSKTPFVSITTLKDKDEVSWRDWVKGDSSATKESGLHAYVLIWPNESNGPWWVQPTTTFSDGSWQSYAYFGRDPVLYPEDSKHTFRVVTIITTLELRGGQTFAELPDNVARSSEITVTRT